MTSIANRTYGQGLPFLDKLFNDANMGDYADYVVNHEGGHTVGARHNNDNDTPVTGIMKNGRPSLRGRYLGEIEFSKESVQ